MSFLEWYKQADEIQRKTCYTFCIQAMCLLPIKQKIKAIYEILRGVKYSKNITNKKYMGVG